MGINQYRKKIYISAGCVGHANLFERRKLFQYLDDGARHVTSATQTNNISLLAAVVLLHFYLLRRLCAKKKEIFEKWIRYQGLTTYIKQERFDTAQSCYYCNDNNNIPTAHISIIKYII